MKDAGYYSGKLNICLDYFVIFTCGSFFWDTGGISMVQFSGADW